MFAAPSFCEMTSSYTVCEYMSGLSIVFMKPGKASGAASIHCREDRELEFLLRTHIAGEWLRDQQG